MFSSMLRALFPSPARQATAAQTEPADETPPPLPPARSRYMLYRQQPGVFDIRDGDLDIGSLSHNLVDPDRGTYWEVRLPGADYDYFPSLKAAKEWLGNPPVRQYR